METREPQNTTENSAGPMLPIENEAARGLRFAHIMLQAIERQEDEALGLVEELNRLLTARGITKEAELADALANSKKESG